MIRLRGLFDQGQIHIPFVENYLVVTRLKPIKCNLFILIGEVLNFGLNKMASNSWQNRQKAAICHGCNFFNIMMMLFYELYMG